MLRDKTWLTVRVPFNPKGAGSGLGQSPALQSDSCTSPHLPQRIISLWTWSCNIEGEKDLLKTLAKK